MQKQDKISIIVPCHNEEEVLPLFLKEIEKIYEVMHVKHNVEMEYLFVDDGSTDRTLMFLREQEAEESAGELSVLFPQFRKRGSDVCRSGKGFR